MVAERGRARIVQADVDTEVAGASSAAGVVELTSPEGIWIEGSTMFVTEDLWPVPSGPSALVEVTLPFEADDPNIGVRSSNATEPESAKTEPRGTQDSMTKCKGAETTDAKVAKAKAAEAKQSTVGARRAKVTGTETVKSPATLAKKSDRSGVRTLFPGLIAPSGLVAASATGPVFVAERYAKSIAWGVYRSRESPQGQERQWFRDGYLANVPNDVDTSPVYLGVAIWRPSEMQVNAFVILAAGPDALYAFGPSGSEIGRIDFDKPVRGVSVAGQFVYIAVGTLLCRIKLLPENLPNVQKNALSQLLVDSPASKRNDPLNRKVPTKLRIQHPHHKCS